MGQPAFASVTTLVDKLLDELEVAIATRERWRIYEREMPEASGLAMRLRVGINFFTLAIADAKRALAHDDAVDSLRALRQLEATAKFKELA